MLLVVIDTNVVVSRYMSPAGPPAWVILRWNQGAFELLVSDDILAEYERALSYPHLAPRHKLGRAGIKQVVAGFRRFATTVTVTERLSVIADDPKDDKFLECAVAGGADVIVSGDKHLLRLGSYQGIRILSPADFLAELDAST